VAESRRYHAGTRGRVAGPVTLEMGKLIDQARGEVALSAAIIDYYAKTPSAFWRTTPQAELGEAVVRKQPRWACSSASSPGLSYYRCALPRPNLMAAMSSGETRRGAFRNAP